MAAPNAHTSLAPVTLDYGDGTIWRMIGQYPHVWSDTIEGWRRPSRGELLTAPADGPLWAWLRAHGIRRPAPSGKSGKPQKGTHRVSLWLDAETYDASKAKADAHGMTLSAYIRSKL